MSEWVPLDFLPDAARSYRDLNPLSSGNSRWDVRVDSRGIPEFFVFQNTIGPQIRCSWVPWWS